MWSPWVEGKAGSARNFRIAVESKNSDSREMRSVSFLLKADR